MENITSLREEIESQIDELERKLESLNEVEELLSSLDLKIEKVESGAKGDSPSGF